MTGVDRLNALQDEMLVNNIISRLDCTTKEVIKTTTTISRRWKNLWTSLPHLIFSDEDDITDLVGAEPNLDGYISFIENTLNQCPTNLTLKKFKLDINFSSRANSDFKLRANSWIRYAISRKVEDVDLRLWDEGVGEEFSYDDEVFFDNLCFNRVKLTWGGLNPPNGAISWGRLDCLILSCVTLDEDMIEKILSGSPCLEALELNDCYGYRRIDITSKSVKELVFSGYNSHHEYYTDDVAYIDCVKINAPYISSLTIEDELVLRELVLLNVSSLVEADLDYSINWRESEIFDEEVFRGLLESLGHVEDITYGDQCLELLFRLEAGSDTSGSDTSGSDTSGSDTSGSDTSGSDTSGSDTSGSDTSGSDTSGSDTSGSDTSGSDTSSSDTSGSDTSGSDTSGSDTSSSDTSGSDTSGSDTSGIAEQSESIVMKGVDRLNELQDEMLVNNIISRLDCTTKEVIKTTTTISTRWKNLWTSLPHLIFSDDDDVTDLVGAEPNLHGYMFFIDNTLNQCPTNLTLKKFKLDINFSSRVNSDFKLRANSWISYAISRKVEDVDLRLWDEGVGKEFSYDDEVFFDNLCFNRVKLTWGVLNPPNGAISWGRLDCLILSCVSLDEDMIEKILSGSPCLESLELNDCYGYRRIDITSKSVKELVFSGYNSHHEYYTDDVAYIDCLKINAPYISSLTIEGELVLRELVLLNVSSLVEADLDYSINWRESEIFDEEVFRGLLESLGHVEDIAYGDQCLELLFRLEAGSDTSGSDTSGSDTSGSYTSGSDTSDDDRVENGDREEQIA